MLVSATTTLEIDVSAKKTHATEILAKAILRPQIVAAEIVATEIVAVSVVAEGFQMKRCPNPARYHKFAAPEPVTQAFYRYRSRKCLTRRSPECKPAQVWHYANEPARN